MIDAEMERQKAGSERVDRRRRRRRRSLWPYAFLAPFLILFTTFLLYPIVNTFLISLQVKDGLSAGRFVGLANYQALLADPRFATAVRNSVALTVWGLLITVPSAFLLALALNSRRLRGRAIFRLVMFLPAASSAVIGAMIGYVFFDQKYGVINSQLGLNVGWLSSASLILPTIYLIILWKYVGYQALYFLAGLQTIDREVVDAARVDGAGQVAIVRYVYIPMVRPILLVVVVLVILSSVQVFAEPFLLTRGTGGPGQGGVTVAMMMWEAAFRQFRLGYGAAIAMVSVVGAIGASLIAVRLLRSDD
jgi:multiple sugar transport system permease protein